MGDKTRNLVKRESYKLPNTCRVFVEIPETIDLVLTDNYYLAVVGVQDSIVAYGIVNDEFINLPIDLVISNDSNYEFDPELATWTYRIIFGSILGGTTYYSYNATYNSNNNTVEPDPVTLLCSLSSAELNGAWSIVVDTGEETMEDDNVTITQTVLSCSLIFESPELDMRLTGGIVDSTVTLSYTDDSINIVFSGILNDANTTISGSAIVTEGEETITGTFVLTKN